MTEPDGLDPGEPGRSARREYERRRGRRQQAKPKGLAGLIACLLGPLAKERRRIADERHWATGAGGEEIVAASLARRCPEVVLLHDRKMPGSPANIDHIAVAASGVYVIDAKRYRGKIVVCKPLFGAAELKIAGRNQTKLVDGLAKQVAVVGEALAGIAAEVAVHGCLCFVAPEGFLAESGLPAVRTLKINGYPLYYPRRLAKCLNGPGPLSPEARRRIGAELAERLPPA
ncbi:MAG: nuclease-related domain-containing protein [Solirubrobacteraceae bacterium]